VLQIDKPHHCSHRLDLAGTGIVLVPCAFIWPTVLVECCGVDQPSLTYPPRGFAELWEDPSDEVTDPLSALIGRTRAILLASLDLPRTTTQLAAQLGLSPPAVRQHLKVLKDTALVTARRRGRMVLYQRTPTATTLLEAIRSHEQTG
jgi:DNA-binding transcriptional ArsR family regulator